MQLSVPYQDTKVLIEGIFLTEIEESFDSGDD